MEPEPQSLTRVRSYLIESAETKRLTADACAEAIATAAGIIADAFRAGGKALICGNGGSAADCQHMAAEFVSRLTKDFERPGLPAIALTALASVEDRDRALAAGFDVHLAKPAEPAELVGAVARLAGR